MVDCAQGGQDDQSWAMSEVVSLYDLFDTRLPATGITAAQVKIVL